MQALSLKELCERWAQELDRPASDVARTLAHYLLLRAYDESALAWTVVLPDNELLLYPPSDATDIPQVPWELELSVYGDLGGIAHQGRDVEWKWLRYVVIDASELQRWLATTKALPAPKFWSVPVETDGAIYEAVGDVAGSQTVEGMPPLKTVLKALAAITMALTENSKKYWKANGDLNVSTVVDRTLNYLEAKPEVKERLGERGLSKSTLSQILSMSLRQSE